VRRWAYSILAGALCFGGGSGALSCSPSEPQTGSQTNWMRACEVSAECGVLSCICNACTRPCDDDSGCSDLEGASCIPASEAGAIAACGGQEYPSAGLCMQRCDDEESCGDSATCVAGVCSPNAVPTADARIDLAVRFQTLVGFGASLAYLEDVIVSHPEKNALFDLMFEDSGIDVVRMRNRFEGDNVADLAAASEILTAAAERLGRAPTTLITEGSPPAALKANGSKVCAGDADVCTLARLDGGEFDYAGLAAHWRASLEAHAEAGIAIDYLSIQNNPDYLPSESQPQDACHFLPVEGTETVSVGGVDTEVAYPGFVEALAAVREAIADLADVPSITAPDVSEVGALPAYVGVLDPASVDALALHLYDLDPDAVSGGLLQDALALAQDFQRPLFQTEMQGNGLDTAILMQSALTLASVSTYLQNDFVGPILSEGDFGALISLQADSFQAEAPFHALRHLAFFTDPGWVRVDASVDVDEVLISAWLSPDEDALSVVVLNSGTTEHNVQLDLGADASFDSSEITRTTFDGMERSATLGPLGLDGVIALPAHALVTVALER
jgi:glucuronoarabinoxylan endo-1,4-beta-xylanase